MDSKPKKPKTTSIYDDGNIPEIDLPHPSNSTKSKEKDIVEPLPESSRPRKDGPGGD